MSYLPGKFVWFEHASNDPAKARAFYEPLFGWHVENMPMGEMQYAMIMNGADGIGGFMLADGGARWVSYVSVPDVDKAYAAALAAGAQSESPPMDYGPVGPQGRPSSTPPARASRCGRARKETIPTRTRPRAAGSGTS